MILLTNEQKESYKMEKIFKISEKKITNNKIYHKVKGESHHTGKYRGATHRIRNLKYSISKKLLRFFIVDRIMIIIL